MNFISFTEHTIKTFNIIFFYINYFALYLDTYRLDLVLREVKATQIQSHFHYFYPHLGKVFTVQKINEF